MRKLLNKPALPLASPFDKGGIEGDLYKLRGYAMSPKFAQNLNIFYKQTIRIK